MRSSLKSILVGVGIGTGLLAASGEAASYTFQGVAQSRDLTLLSDWMINANVGADTTLGLGNQAGPDKRTLIGFDLSSIPAGATVTSATLRLTLVSNVGTDTDPLVNGTASIYTVFGTNAGWGEGATGYSDPAGAGEATWNYANHNTVTWRNSAGAGSFPGLGNPGDAYAASVVGSFPVFGHGPAYETYVTNYTQTVTLSDLTGIQNWLVNPAQNAGFLIRVNTGTNLWWNYYSSEVANASFQPMLTIEASIPEPASAAVLGLAGLGLSACRRRR